MLTRFGHGGLPGSSRDPSSVGVPAVAGRPAVFADAEGLPFRNVILQALGACPETAVFTSGLALRHGDCLLLCSDGLSCQVPEVAMTDIVLTSHTLDAAAGRLVDFANECGGADDDTTVLLAGVWCPPETIRRDRIRPDQRNHGA